LNLGCERIATGHYARLEQRADSWHLLRARDAHKDQSYFLHRLFQSQLAHVLFPLGDWTKAEAVDYAKRRKLPVRFNAESQDLCFISDEGYVPFLEKQRPRLKKEGPIVDTQGREIGRHEGFHRFTVGQREGVGVAAASRLYVKGVHPEDNVVVVGTREEVMSRECKVRDVHWVSGSPPADKVVYNVKLRYRHKGSGAEINLLDQARVRVVFEEPQFAVTPGQAAVFYDGDEVLGGGWIEPQ